MVIPLVLLFRARLTERAGEMLKKAEEKGVKILLPLTTLLPITLVRTLLVVVPSDQIPADRMGMDIGPKTAEFTLRQSRRKDCLLNEL